MRSSVPGAVAGMVCAALPPLLVGSLSSTMAADMHVGAAAIAALVSASYLTAALLSPFGGTVVQRIGAATALRLVCAIDTVGLALLALAPGRVGVLLALLLLGIPNALIQPASNRVLTSAQPRWRGLLFGAVQSAIPVATLLSGVLLAGFHRGGTWRLALWLAVLLTLVSQLLIRRERSFATPTGTVLPQLARIGGRLFVPAMVGIGFLGSAAATSLAVFGASGGVDVGLTAGAAAACQIAGSLCCIAVRISAAWYGGRAAGGRLLNLVALLLVGGTMAFLALAHHHAATFGVGMALAYGCGWGWTGLFNLTLAWARPEQVAQITGMTQMGLFLGSVVGPALFARLVDLHGYALGWLGCGVATSVAVGTAAVLAARVRPAVPCGGEDERRTRVTT